MGISVSQYSSHFLLWAIQIVGLATNNLGPVYAAFVVIPLPKSLQYQK